MRVKRSEILAAATLSAAAVFLGLLGSLQAGADAGATDTKGRPIPPQALERIVSIGGDVTEILYALGLADKIVAVDATSQFPAEALLQKKSVGYMRQLSSEGVLSTSPGIIVASRGSGPPEVVKALQAANVPYVEVPDTHDPKGVADKVRLIAGAADATEKGEALARDIEQKFTDLESERRKLSKPVKGIFILSVQKGVATLGGAGTSGDAIMKLAGIENAAAGFNGYKPMVDEALIEMQPDVIVVMKRSDPRHDALKALDDVKGVAATPAGKNRRIVAMDALYLLGFGPRAPAAAHDLMLTVYPELKPAATP